VLVFGDEHLPPKYTVGLAFQYATGKRLTPQQFSGGAESNGVLTRLGFSVRLKRDARAQWTSDTRSRGRQDEQGSKTRLRSAGLPSARTANVAGTARSVRALVPTTVVPAMRVAAIGLRAGLSSQRGDHAVKALESCFRGWNGARLALFPGVSNDFIDREAWVEAIRTAARTIGAVVLFESTGNHDTRCFWAYDGTSGTNLLAVRQVFSTSTEANRDPSLVNQVLSRSAPGGTGSTSVAGRAVGLLVCGENNVLRNEQSANNAVSVRHHPHKDLFGHAEIVCNGAHTVMGNWGKLDRRFEYLSRQCRVALYATNCDGASWRSACRVYFDGRRIASGGGVDESTANARVIHDSHEMYRAVILDLAPRSLRNAR
jgi:hypothetical protein